jgi:hypothetical protein
MIDSGGRESVQDPIPKNYGSCHKSDNILWQKLKERHTSTEEKVHSACSFIGLAYQGKGY